jgi:hypothetical protein
LLNSDAKELETLVTDITRGWSIIEAHLRMGEIFNDMKFARALHMDLGMISPKIRINGVIIRVVIVATVLSKSA